MTEQKGERTTKVFVQVWRDVGAISFLSLFGFRPGWTLSGGLLFVILIFLFLFIFGCQAGSFSNPTPAQILER